MYQITKAKKVYRFRAIPDGGSSVKGSFLVVLRRIQKTSSNRGVTNHPRPVLAPGSALGLLLSIALSSGQANTSVEKCSSLLQSTTRTDFRKEDISNELRTRTFLMSCNRKRHFPAGSAAVSPACFRDEFGSQLCRRDSCVPSSFDSVTSAPIKTSAMSVGKYSDEAE